MKFLRRFILLILIVILIVGGVFYINGKKLYDSKIAQVSLEDKVASIKSDKSFVSLDSLPDYYKNAVIAVEDHRYNEHGAIDFIAIGRAIYSNIQQKDFVEGGSTITQQTAKNLYFINEDDVASRKVAETILGFELEKKYSKNEILELYVNTIYFGDGYYGIEEAAQGYLGKSAKDMTLYESTMLAGIPNAPSVYAPTVDFSLTKSRQKKVVSSMLEYGYINQTTADELIEQINTATYEKPVASGIVAS